MKATVSPVLAGNQYSYIDYELHAPYEDKSYTYVTNRGRVTLSEKGEVLECCYRLGTNIYDCLSITIDSNRFRVSVGAYLPEMEIVNHPEMSLDVGKLELDYVLSRLAMDTYVSIAGAAVKKALFKLINRTLKLSRSQKAQCKEILAKWRKPIKLREPIIGGKK